MKTIFSLWNWIIYLRIPKGNSPFNIIERRPEIRPSFYFAGWFASWHVVCNICSHNRHTVYDIDQDIDPLFLRGEHLTIVN
jgi:hypothetical protein